MSSCVTHFFHACHHSKNGQVGSVLWGLQLSPQEVSESHGDRAGCPQKLQVPPGVAQQCPVWVWRCLCCPEEGQEGACRVSSGLLVIQNCRKLHQLLLGEMLHDRCAWTQDPTDKALHKGQLSVVVLAIHSSWAHRVSARVCCAGAELQVLIFAGPSLHSNTAHF